MIYNTPLNVFAESYANIAYNETSIPLKRYTHSLSRNRTLEHIAELENKINEIKFRDYAFANFKFSRFTFIQLFHNNIETRFKRYYPLVSRYDDVNVSFKELYDNITLYNSSDCTDIPLGYISKKEKTILSFRL